MCAISPRHFLSLRGLKTQADDWKEFSDAVEGRESAVAARRTIYAYWEGAARFGQARKRGVSCQAIRTAYHACNATMPFRRTANIRSFPSLLKGRRPRRECTPVLYAIPAENSSKTKNLRPEAIFTTIYARYFPCRTEYITQTAKCETKILCFRRL